MNLVQGLHVVRQEVQVRLASRKACIREGSRDLVFLLELERADAALGAAIWLEDKLEDPVLIEAAIMEVPPWIRSSTWHICRRLVAERLPTRPPDVPTTRPPES